MLHEAQTVDPVVGKGLYAVRVKVEIDAEEEQDLVLDCRMCKLQTSPNPGKCSKLKPVDSESARKNHPTLPAVSDR